MSLEFLRPGMLLLLPACMAAVWFLRRKNRRISLTLRSLLCLLCVLALSAPSARIAGGNSAVWILTDASDSARVHQEAMTQAIRKAIDSKNASVDAGVISFGGNAMVEAPLSADPAYHGVRTAVDAQATDLGKALSLAGALLPSDAGGRIAVLSDGLTEDVSSQAKALAARGIPVDVLPFAPEQAPDAQVSAVTLPSSAYAGQAFSVTVQVDARLDTAAPLVLYQNRTPVDTRSVQLRKGENTFVFRDVAATSGTVTYEARLVAQGDERSQNDSLGAYIRIEGTPRLLLVEGSPGEGSEMAAMLSAAAMDYDTILPFQLPAAAEQLQRAEQLALSAGSSETMLTPLYAMLEQCFRELEDYKEAYHYAAKQIQR